MYESCTSHCVIVGSRKKDLSTKNGYTMIEGNMNSEASGALKKEVGVYMGYTTTTDRDEAVTDIAVIYTKSTSNLYFLAILW